MRVLLIDNGSTFLEKLRRLVPGSEVVVKRDEVKARDAEGFDLVVLSGGGYNTGKGRNSPLKPELFTEELAIIRSGKPIIGICLGCELIALAFGSKLIELPEKQKGLYEVELLDKNLGTGTIQVYEAHNWALQELPPGFTLLAKSERGPEIIKHETLPIYGFQFHPENMVDQTGGDELFLKLFSTFEKV